MAAPILGSIFAYLLFVGVVVVLLLSIMFLVHSIKCITKPGNSYERFKDTPQTEETRKKIEDHLLSTMQSLIKQIDGVLEGLQTKFPEEMDNITDKTCKVYETVQDSFIKNKAEMQDSSEIELSESEREKLAQKRLSRGKEQFEGRKQLYIAKRKIPLYECFENPTQGNNLEDVKTDLDLKTEELNSLLTSDVFQKRIKSIDSLKSSIGFNVMFLNESIKDLTKAVKENEEKEGFADKQTLPTVSDIELGLPFSILSANDSQKTYIESIRKAMATLKSITNMPQLASNDLDTLFKTQNELWGVLNQKKRDLETNSENKAIAEQKKRQKTSDEAAKAKAEAKA